VEVKRKALWRCPRKTTGPLVPWLPLPFHHVVLCKKSAKLAQCLVFDAFIFLLFLIPPPLVLLPWICLSCFGLAACMTSNLSKVSTPIFLGCHLLWLYPCIISTASSRSSPFSACLWVLMHAYHYLLVTEKLESVTGCCDVRYSSISPVQVSLLAHMMRRLEYFREAQYPDSPAGARPKVLRFPVFFPDSNAACVWLPRYSGLADCGSLEKVRPVIALHRQEISRSACVPRVRRRSKPLPNVILGYLC
jgi:hypothetical protein